MRRLLVIALLVVGCRDTDRARPAQQSAPTPAPTDPWNVKPDPDAPPDLAQRHRDADQACPSVTGPYFYRIEKANKVSYVLGTRHLGVSLAKFPPSVDKAIASAKLAVFELAPGDTSTYQWKKIALREALGPEVWAHYQRMVGAAVAKAVEHAAPGEAILAIVAMNEDISAMLDKEIEDKVIAAKTPTRGLETRDFQHHLLEDMFDVRMLRAVIHQTKDRAEAAEKSHKALAKYCTGTETAGGLDDETHDQLVAEGYTHAELDAIEDKMVYSRNATWIPKLEAILAEGDVFIAVGAAHLRGPRGIVTLLEQRGYKLTRITK